MEEIFKGKIKEFCGSWLSGLGQLLIEDSKTGIVQGIPCDNSPTVRSLENAFGNTISEGHTAEGVGYKNQEVFYFCDSMGILEWFVPIKEAPKELVKMYNKGGE